MAKDTLLSLRNSTMYSVFVRNYSDAGTFRALEEDLPRIRALGTDIIWLMPIHPTGEKNRKGALGSPYAIRDYRAINPEYGTIEDFAHLVDAIHAQGMKCIIDVVYNHTSPDSVLSADHPEYFYHLPDGSFGNRVGDWWDVIDLDYSNAGLWTYQIETLKIWAQYVDGFRCDVAPLVPVGFWNRAREEVASVRPGCIWLAESAEPAFMTFGRSSGIPMASDGELYSAFDLCYDYDAYPTFDGVLTGKNSLSDYAGELNRQEIIYPANYVKLRFLENHDRLRASYLIRDPKALVSWTAFNAFQKGCTLIYNGQEKGVTHTPGLFDKDTIDWNHGTIDLSDLMARLSVIRKDPIFADSTYHVRAEGDTLIATHTENPKSPVDPAGGRMVGVFETKGVPAVLSVRKIVPDGIYENLIDHTKIEVAQGHLSTDGSPIILKVEGKENG
ncbi:MAG TPA: alpha-amylase [Lachnospiraceae bacterium]|nr:alpha-amylase [Lachnospiraceae bacterium]